MSLPSGTRSLSYSQDMAFVHTKTQWMLLILGLVFLFTMPLYLPRDILYLVNLIGITIIVVQGLNILTGCCGQVSLGQAAFMMVGAYTSAWLSIYLDLSFWLILPIAGLSAGLVGLIFGAPSLRIKGFYLAMSTLAAQFIIPWCIRNINPSWTGGHSIIRLPAPTLGNLIFNTESSMFYIIITLTVFVVFFTKNLIRTRVGKAFVAIRDNDLAAEVTGIDIFRYKLLAFFISAVYAGIAGCLWAFWYRNVYFSHFELDQSIWYLGMLVVGGMGNGVLGACIGPIFIRVLDFCLPNLGPALVGLIPSFVSQSDVIVALKPTFFGLIILLFIIFEPRGLSHRWEMFKLYYRLWPFSSQGR